MSDILFHRWSPEAIEAKGKAAKGSKAKKTDDVETFVYRCEDGTIGVPGEYLRQSIIHAAKFRQDPRSPRKSAMDLFKAGVLVDDTIVVEARIVKLRTSIAPPEPPHVEIFVWPFVG